jgi:hypothetical protein
MAKEREQTQESVSRLRHVEGLQGEDITIPPARAGKHPVGRPKADNALIRKLEHPIGARRNLPKRHANSI